MPKVIKFNREAREKLLRGVSTVADAVGSTLGPRSYNVAIGQRGMLPYVMHDGVTVARSISLVDQFENIGAQLLIETASKTNQDAGDGTTTSIILAQSLVSGALKYIQSGINPMLLRNELENAKNIVVHQLKKMAKKVSASEQVEQIATISSTDLILGKIVAAAINRVGKEGVVAVEDGKGLETTVEFKEGLEIDRGYTSPYFVTDKGREEAVLENPYILLTDIKINHNFEILPFLEMFIKTSKNLVIIASEVTDEALSTLVVNNLKGTLNTVVIRAPAFGEGRINELEDIAVITGGKVITMDSGRELKSVVIEELGRASKFTSTKDKSILIGGKGNKSAVTLRIEDLKNQIKNSTTDFDKSIKEQRLAKLSGGAAVIYVGGSTEPEMRERKERVIDAKNATKAAIEEGIVPGGGVVLLEISRKPFWSLVPHGRLLQEALRQPFKRLMDNGGYDYAEMWGKIWSSKYPNGIDVIDGKLKNLLVAGIVDPVKVVRMAVENAVSIASMIITTNTIIVNKEEK